MCDRSTSFRVFINLGDNSCITADSESEYEANAKVTETPTTYKLCVSSNSGYVTVPLFLCIMKHLVKWWDNRFPELDCYLLRDKLHVHINDKVLEFTEANSVYIETNMPGSSQWFQVHDQNPFANLKKK